MARPEFFDTPGYGAIARTRNYYSQALRIGDRIEISGQGGWEADFTLSKHATTLKRPSLRLAPAGATS
jgi:enamine deaminase RidA (YjgF/YER057c/UK114 family)